MYQHFVNRAAELDFLEGGFASGNAEFVVLYGRRRVGKTELILKFLTGKKGAYFLASKEGDRENIKSFSAQMARLLGEEQFGLIEYGSWESVFASLKNNVKFREISKTDKIILIFDEFPFLIYSNRAIPSIFQKVWELYLKHENIMLILLGSSVSVMESEVLGSESPLYGRRTAQWWVQPLDFIFLKKFFPQYSVQELMEVWFILGGIPAYLLKFDPSLSVFKNIEKNVLKKGAYLYDEAEFLLKDEFREPKNYKLILKAVSLGSSTMGEICNATGFDKSMVSKYLAVLGELGITREELPLTASAKSKKRHYSIADPYFNFWFRYVYPRRIDLEALRHAEVLADVTKDFGTYAGRMFEQLVDGLLRGKKLLPDMSFERIGRWWYGGEEIDILAVNSQKGEILFGECEWKEGVDGNKVLSALREKAKKVRWGESGCREYYAIFAKSFRRKADAPGVFQFGMEEFEKQLF